MALPHSPKSLISGRKLVGFGSIALTLSLMAGCVSADKYQASVMERNRLNEQLTDAQRKEQSAQAEAATYKKNYDDLMSRGSNSEGIISSLQNENGQLKTANSDLQARYDEAMRRVGEAGQGMALPEPLTNELTAFAAQNPDLVDFDAARGIVKFKSDVTFAVGEATLTDKALSVISRFSQILDSAAAANYELLVAGHTDSSPVRNPRTVAAGNKDNWYLSAHRAISVGEALMRDGVTGTRIGVVGYADQRPIASNATEAGKAQNRRVEVLILPTQVRNGAVAGGGGNAVPAAERTAPARHRAADNKDNDVMQSK